MLDLSSSSPKPERCPRRFFKNNGVLYILSEINNKISNISIITDFTVFNKLTNSDF